MTHTPSLTARRRETLGVRRGSGPRRPPTTGAYPRPRVLIVEDDHDLRELYAWTMEESGWLVEAVANGEDGLAIAPMFAPHVIVMDLLLPALDGLEVIRRLKANALTKHMPIVACTAVRQGPAEELARGAGCEEFLGKPCPPEDLRAVLEHLLKRST
jgi:two-component system cell cycle response regulator DivK